MSVPRILLVLVALLLATAPADARRRVLGSSLTASATRVEAHQADTAFWPTRIRGRSFRAPADGQVLAIRLKGTVLKRRGAPDPLNEVHFQSLQPLRGGRVRALLTSQPFSVPIGGARDQVTTYRPENLCVVKGGVVAFNDEGGWMPPWYQQGAPFRVFGRVPGSRTARYTANNNTNNSDVFRPTVRRDSELLLQYVLGTGGDMSGACRAWHAQH